MGYLSKKKTVGVHKLKLSEKKKVRPEWEGPSCEGEGSKQNALGTVAKSNGQRRVMGAGILSRP